MIWDNFDPHAKELKQPCGERMTPKFELVKDKNSKEMVLKHTKDIDQVEKIKSHLEETNIFKQLEVAEITGTSLGAKESDIYADVSNLGHDAVERIEKAENTYTEAEVIALLKAQQEANKPKADEVKTETKPVGDKENVQ